MFNSRIKYELIRRARLYSKSKSGVYICSGCVCHPLSLSSVMWPADGPPDLHWHIHRASWRFSQWTPEHRGPAAGRCGHLLLWTGTWHSLLTLGKKKIQAILQQFTRQSGSKLVNLSAYGKACLSFKIKAPGCWTPCSSFSSCYIALVLFMSYEVIVLSLVMYIHGRDALDIGAK